MKRLSLSLAIPVLAALSLAGPTPKHKVKPAPKTISCCVMPANKVNIANAMKHHMYADYKGNRYFFCCEGCPAAFHKNPAKYAKQPHIKIPKAHKK